jgi:leucyl aminopeptidase
MIKRFTLPLVTLLTTSALSAMPTSPVVARHWVLTDAKLLRSLGHTAAAQDKEVGVAIANLSDAEITALSQKVHEAGRCGGFEQLDELAETHTMADFARVLAPLKTEFRKNQLARQKLQARKIQDGTVKRDFIEQAVAQVSADNLQQTVIWYSSFETRFNKEPQRGMVAVEALYKKLEALTAGAKDRVSVAFIRHQSTPQYSIRVRFKGSQRPTEKVVVGAHLDSVNWNEGAAAPAPGADDNGSGTANLVELTRILATTPQPERTIDVYFYAGEESGLLGSKEIAIAHKNAHADVVGALQLDMTLHPGSGEGAITLVDDFTSVPLTNYIRELNALYVQAKLNVDTCGYGCSDHASWFRQGFPSAFPFEAQHDSMNRDIHTRQDVINSRSSFVHSAYFSRLALAFVLDLANSTARPGAAL